MTVVEVKEIFNLKKKIAGGNTSPLSDTDLSSIFYEALIYVATKCIPKELLREEFTEDEVLREIKNGYFIATPIKPIFNTEDPSYNENTHIMIDTDLEYAVINKAVAISSRDLKTIAKFEDEAARVINRYKANFNKVGD